MGKRHPDVIGAFGKAGAHLAGVGKKGIYKAVSTAKKHPKKAAALATLAAGAVGNPHLAALGAAGYGAHKIYQHFNKKKGGSSSKVVKMEKRPAPSEKMSNFLEKTKGKKRVIVPNPNPMTKELRYRYE